MRDVIDKPRCRELSQCIADRTPRYPEAIGKRLLVQTRARSQSAGDDLVGDLVTDRLRQRLVGFQAPSGLNQRAARCAWGVYNMRGKYTMLSKARKRRPAHQAHDPRTA